MGYGDLLVLARVPKDVNSSGGYAGMAWRPVATLSCPFDFRLMMVNFYNDTAS